jgi:hypothetical protein
MTADLQHLLAGTEDPDALAPYIARANAEFFLSQCRIRNFQRGEEIDFVERPIQVEFREALQNEQLVVALKAREVGWTWELALFVLWEMWHFAPYQCIYFCQREDNAHDFIRRVRWAHAQLAPNLGYPAEYGTKAQGRFAIIDEKGAESEVLAFPSVPSALQTWHPRRVIADEWGLIEQPVLAAALGAIGLDGYFVGLGTAEGIDNEHARVYMSCRDGRPEKYAPERRRFYKVFACWQDNPNFVDEEGQPMRPSGGTRRDTERMYPEDDQEAFALTFPGDPVYPEFRGAIHVAAKDLPAVPGIPIMRGWDFGNTPACVVVQFNNHGQLIILREFMATRPGIYHFGEEVKRECTLEWPDHSWIDYGDPSGAAVRETDARSCFEILRDDLGIAIKTGGTAWVKRREAVARRLTSLSDGEPALLVNPRCKLMREGFQGGYFFAPQKDAQAVEQYRETRYQGRGL